MSVHERCWLCQFWNGERCTNTFRLVIHLTPADGVGGQVEFSTTPGMVPEELIPKLNERMHAFFNKILAPISMLPWWDEIRQFQEANPEREDCPGRRVNPNKEEFMRVSKGKLDG